MPQFENVNLAQIYGAADEAKARQLQNQVIQNQFARQQKQDMENDQIKGAYAFTPDGQMDEKATLGNLYKVAPQKAYEFQQALTQRDMAAAKAKREESSAKLGDAEKVYTLLKKSSGFVLANPTLQNALQVTQQFGQLTGQDVSSELASLQQIGDNPEGLKRWAAGHSLDADKLLPQFKSQDIGGSIQQQSIDPITGEVKVLGNTNKTQTPDSIASNALTRAGQAITIRGQNMTDARAREANANGGKAPAGYRFNPDGTLSAILGGPGDKTLNPTEVQGKASLFSKRALEADKILGSVGQDYSPMGINTKQGAEDIPLIGGVAGPAVNAMLSVNSQKAEQAQRDFVNAVLRQESGAAIGQSEFNNARKQYFAQPGDSQAVIQQKAQNRRTAIEGLNTMAGPLKSELPAQSKAPAGPKLGTVQDGYVYTGGDPSKQSSWKKK